MASRSHSRMSVATWSLRERPVCRRLPASPTSAVSRASMLRCTSSRSRDHDELAARDFGADRRHATLDVGQVGRGDDAGRRQHSRVGERARDVGFGEALVEVDRRGVPLDEFGNGFGETARPAALRPVGAGFGRFGVGHGGNRFRSCLSAPGAPAMRAGGSAIAHPWPPWTASPTTQSRMVGRSPRNLAGAGTMLACRAPYGVDYKTKRTSACAAGLPQSGDHPPHPACGQSRRRGGRAGAREPDHGRFTANGSRRPASSSPTSCSFSPCCGSPRRGCPASRSPPAASRSPRDRPGRNGDLHGPGSAGAVARRARCCAGSCSAWSPPPRCCSISICGRGPCRRRSPRPACRRCRRAFARISCSTASTRSCRWCEATRSGPSWPCRTWRTCFAC